MALRIAEAAVGAARLVARAVPPRLKKRVEDGVFHYIFQKTRVENDNYGWRPSSPGGGEPPPGFGPTDPPGSAPSGPPGSAPSGPPDPAAPRRSG